MKERKKSNEPSKQDPSQVEWKDAFIVNAELGMQLIRVMEELPIKYSKDIIPLLKALHKAPRTNVTVTVPPLESEKPEGQ